MPSRSLLSRYAWNETDTYVTAGLDMVESGAMPAERQQVLPYLVSTEQDSML